MLNTAVAKKDVILTVSVLLNFGNFHTLLLKLLFEF